MNWRAVRLVGLIVAVSAYLAYYLSGLGSEDSYWRGLPFLAILIFAGVMIVIDIVRMKSE